MKFSVKQAFFNVLELRFGATPCEWWVLSDCTMVKIFARWSYHDLSHSSHCRDLLECLEALEILERMAKPVSKDPLDLRGKAGPAEHADSEVSSSPVVFLIWRWFYSDIGIQKYFCFLFCFLVFERLKHAMMPVFTQKCLKEGSHVCVAGWMDNPGVWDNSRVVQTTLTDQGAYNHPRVVIKTLGSLQPPWPVIVDLNTLWSFQIPYGSYKYCGVVKTTLLLSKLIWFVSIIQLVMHKQWWVWKRIQT